MRLALWIFALIFADIAMDFSAYMGAESSLGNVAIYSVFLISFFLCVTMDVIEIFKAMKSAGLVV